MGHAADKLVQDMKTVVGDTEELLKATVSQSGERIALIRARAEESLRTARARVKDVTGAAVRDVQRRVHERPWTAAGIAAGIGFVAGILLARK